MNVLRLTVLSLTLVTVVVTLGYVNSAVANKPDSDGNHDHAGDSENENLGSADCTLPNPDTGYIVSNDGGGII